MAVRYVDRTVIEVARIIQDYGVGLRTGHCHAIVVSGRARGDEGFASTYPRELDSIAAGCELNIDRLRTEMEHAHVADIDLSDLVA